MNSLRRYLTAVLGLAMVITLGTGCSKQARKDRILSRANANFEVGQYDKAEIEYLNILKQSPGDPVAIARLGLIYHAQGRVLSALAWLRKASELDTNNIEVRLNLGKTYLGVNQRRAAWDLATRVLQQDPGNHEALLLMTDSASDAEEIQQVIQRIERFSEAERDQSDVHLALGSLYLRQQDTNRAEVEFNLALARDPKSSAAHLALGNFLLLRNDIKGAEHELKAASELAPLRSAQLFPYAQLLLSQTNVQGARATIQSVTEKAPDYLPAWTFLAQLAFAQREIEECDRLIQNILSRDPSHYEALLIKGSLMVGRGDSTNAVAHFEQMAGSIYGQLPQVQYQLALAHLGNNNLTKGMESLSRAITLNTNFVQASLLLGELNLRKGDTALAIVTLRQLTNQQPQLGRAYLMLADAYQAQRDPEAALEVYGQLLARVPADSRILLLRGDLLARMDRRAEAREDFIKSLESAPDYVPALEKLVDMDLLDKQYAAALDRIQIAMKRDPNSPNPWLLEAKVYMARNDLDQAEASLLQANEKNPDLQVPYLLLAKTYVDTKKYPQALQRLQELVGKHTNNVSALLQIGMIQDHVKNYDAARESYEKVMAINPSSVLALNNLAYLYSERLGRMDKAYELARRAAELAPDEPSTADTLGWIYFKRGEYSRALTLLQESVGKLPDSAEIHYHLGATHYMLGEPDPARLHLQRALDEGADYIGKQDARERLALLSLDTSKADASTLAGLEKRTREVPDDPIALGVLAAIHELQGNLEKAADSYERALKITPRNVGMTARLAMVYERLNDSQKALKLARHAHNLAPEDARISHHLGRLVFQTGDYKWAASLLAEGARKFQNEPGFLYDLAWSQYSMGQVPEAVASMRQAAQGSLPPARATEADRFLTLVDAAGNQDKTQAVAPVAQAVLEKNPNDVPALMVGARMHEQQGRFREAAQSYDRALALYPFFLPATRNLAILWAEQLGDDEKAYELAITARNALPQDAELAKVLGVLAYRRGDYRRSKEFLSESERTRSGDASLLYHLGMAYYQLKEPDECRRTLQRALALGMQSTLAEEAKRVLAGLK
ncbi:MAG: tetratricopeptide repeat protein [Verrucomicrobia bacterium]|nr:tetratricopeptide repeat protein [Verrucomicrobiota bacterium]